LLAGTVCVLSFLMSVHLLPDRVSLHVGDRSSIEIRANRSVGYTDSDATLRQKHFAADRVDPIYEMDQATIGAASRAVSQIFDEIKQVKEDPSLGSNTRKAEKLSAQLGTVFTKDQLRYLCSAKPEALDALQITAAKLVDGAMNRPIRSATDDLTHARARLNMAADRIASMKADAGILRSIGVEALRPNRFLNQRRTDQLREMAMRAVPSIQGEVRLGDVIVREGEVFTQQDLDKCAALGLVSPQMDLQTALAILGLIAGMAAIVVGFIRRTDPALYGDNKRLLLLSAIVIASVFGLKAFGTMFGISLTGVQFGYMGMMSVVAAGMLIAVLLNPGLAILVTALLSVQSGLMMNHEIRFPIMTLIGSMVGIYFVSDIRDRSAALRASLALALTNVALVWVLGGLLGDSMREVLYGTAWAVAAAILAVCIFWYGVMVLEKPFGILTHVALLELSASEKPLLRQLCITAPGTYAHSIMVGNLAEAAAEAIGADTLFCRVASYYHDVGKMKHPLYFCENQMAENAHDKLSPSLSALVIAAHVKDGLQMADEHHLPRQIKEVISEHHGTSLIRFFYHQAMTEARSGERFPAARDTVLEQHFRSDGPKPQTRESGIIMLADTVEAASRSMERPTRSRLQGLVESLVHDKLVDGQLNESNLTLKDIERVQAVFVKMLGAMFHGRVEYPDRAEAVVATIEITKRDIPQTGLFGDVTASSSLTTEGPALKNADLLVELPTPPGPDKPVAAGRPDCPAE
jgi:putative nucleotidyltransferase with HDIG domain